MYTWAQLVSFASGGVSIVDAPDGSTMDLTAYAAKYYPGQTLPPAAAAALLPVQGGAMSASSVIVIDGGGNPHQVSTAAELLIALNAGDSVLRPDGTPYKLANSGGVWTLDGIASANLFAELAKNIGGPGTTTTATPGAATTGTYLYAGGSGSGGPPAISAGPGGMFVPVTLQASDPSTMIHPIGGTAQASTPVPSRPWYKQTYVELGIAAAVVWLLIAAFSGGNS